jgi:hypothetical protein
MKICIIRNTQDLFRGGLALIKSVLFLEILDMVMRVSFSLVNLFENYNPPFFTTDNLTNVQLDEILGEVAPNQNK